MAEEHSHEDHIEEELELIVLHDKEGNSHGFYVIDRVTIKADGLDGDYLILFPEKPETEEDAGSYLITRVSDHPTGEGVVIDFIETEEELGKVAAILVQVAESKAVGNNTGEYRVISITDPSEAAEGTVTTFSSQPDAIRFYDPESG